jgi:hypothetical protein
MAHASLMGAISLKATSTVRCYGPSRASRSGGFFVVRSMAHSKFPGESRNGRPGSRGSRRRGACPTVRGLPEGTRREAGYRWQSEPFKGSLSRRAVHSAATEFVSSFGLPRLAAQPNAGGEDFGYFAPGKERVRIPPLTHALWRCPGKGCHAPQHRFSERSTCVAVTERRYRLFPSVLCRRASLGTAVVKMSVTSGRAPAALWSEVAGSNPTGRNAVAQSLLFGAATASSVPRQLSTRFVVKIAATSSATREVAGSNPVRRPMRR